MIQTPQNLQKRTYYGKQNILPNYGFIDWDSFSGEFIARLCRALTFGHSKNNLGTLKIPFENTFIIVRKVEVSIIQRNNAEPGTILSIGEEGLYLATCTSVIKCNNFFSNQGNELTLEALQQDYGFVKGIKLPIIKFNLIDYSKILSKEHYWVTQIKKITIHSLFSSVTTRKLLHSNQVINLKIDFYPAKIENSITLSAILIYLYRLNDYEGISVSILNENLFNINNTTNSLYSSLIPCNVNWAPETPFAAAIIECNEKLIEINENLTFLNDLLVREPELDGFPNKSKVIINMTEHRLSRENLENCLLYFQYLESENSLVIYHWVNEEFALFENMGLHIKNILIQAITNPQKPLSQFCFLTSQEIKKLTSFAEGEFANLPGSSLVALFEKQVLLGPNKPAIKFKNKIISYLELWQMSESIRQYLQALNLLNNAFVGLYLPRSPEMIAVILGILRANFVYVPLDTHYPFNKLETIIKEADLYHVITVKEFSDGLITHFSGKKAPTWHCIEEILLGSTIPEFYIGTNEDTNDLENLGYVIFTSGTTGVPKGVMVSQKNIINYCNWFSKSTQFNCASIIDFSSSIAFDLSVPCTLVPLISGGTIAICDEWEKANPKLYLGHLKEKQVTHLELTPGYLELLLNYPETIKTLTDLKVLLLGADVVHSPEVIRWLELCPSHQVINEYGPTETTVSATSYFANVEDIAKQATVPIGKPGFNSSSYVLDRYQNLCPLGVKGELYIGGYQVAKGYLGKPELTKERFVNLSFRLEEKFYRTGDLVSWLSSGNLQFHGRGDQQIKIQGYRVELAAIESVLLKHASIHQAVIVVQYSSNKKFLRAYVVPKDKIIEYEIKSFLSQFLPLYMIPKEFYITNEIPLKENEKIDFDKLLKQPSQCLSSEYRSTQGLNITESLILNLWRKIFLQDKLSIYDDFFKLGGDSLSALQIVAEVSKEFQINVPLHYIFGYPTIFKFARKIESIINSSVSKNRTLLKTTSPIIKLSSGRDEPPLFIVHPVGGSIFCGMPPTKTGPSSC